MSGKRSAKRKRTIDENEDEPTEKNKSEPFPSHPIKLVPQPQRWISPIKCPCFVYLLKILGLFF